MHLCIKGPLQCTRQIYSWLVISSSKAVPTNWTSCFEELPFEELPLEDEVNVQASILTHAPAKCLRKH
jgi:hypothetical protein